MSSFIDTLKKNIQGDVKSTQLDSYSTDESIFSIQPDVVVCPKNVEDVQTVVEIASENHFPITARGGGTGTAGQSIGSGIILDFSVYMDRILDVTKTHAIVEPGVVLKDLISSSKKMGSKFGPDPGSWDRCTMGGMIANNAAGPHALLYGSTRDHVESLDLVLSNGKLVKSGELSTQMQSYVKEISKHADLIRSSHPKVDKNSSGYHLAGLLESPPSFEKLITGSEGTLALVTQAKVKLVPLKEKIVLGIFGFESMGKALMQVKALRASKACCIELLDSTILNVIRKENPTLIQELGLEKASASLWVEWCDAIPEEFKKTVSFIEGDSEKISTIWGERSKVSRWLHDQASIQNRKPLRCIEDACVPIDQLITFVMEATDLMERHDCIGAIFGHVGNGHLHINPSIRIDVPNLSKRVQALMDEFYDLVIALGGTISGEHGDGILRVPYAKKQWKEVWPLFEFVKKSFDPKGIFNPDRKVPVVSMAWPTLKFAQKV